MKKVLSLVLILMLCLASAALAVPSKTTGDLITITIIAPADAGDFFLRPITPSDAGYDARVATCNAEIAKLAKAASPAEYFGDVKDKNGETVDLSGVANVNEFCPVIAGNYDESMGEVTVNIKFATAYPAGETVQVLFGAVNPDSVTWTAYAGLGQEDGTVTVEGIAPATVLAVQNGEALMAVASK